MENSSVAYVDEKSVAIAEEIEGRFSKLSPSSGVLFVGVRAVPAAGGRSSQFEVVLGIQRKLEVAFGEFLVRQIVQEYKTDDISFTALVYRGALGAARDRDTRESRSVAS